MGLIDAMLRRAEAAGDEESAEDLRDLKEELRPTMEALDDIEFSMLQGRMQAIHDCYKEALPKLREAGYPENLAHAKVMELIWQGSTPWPETPEEFVERKGWKEK